MSTMTVPNVREDPAYRAARERSARLGREFSAIERQLRELGSAPTDGDPAPDLVKAYLAGTAPPRLERGSTEDLHARHRAIREALRRANRDVSRAEAACAARLLEYYAPQLRDLDARLVAAVNSVLAIAYEQDELLAELYAVGYPRAGEAPLSFRPRRELEAWLSRKR
jgi:hypothetical protein